MEAVGDGRALGRTGDVDQFQRDRKACADDHRQFGLGRRVLVPDPR
jgi:hypothetical protein